MNNLFDEVGQEHAEESFSDVQALFSNLIQKDLGWSPKTNIEVGINKTIKWYKENCL